MVELLHGLPEPNGLKKHRKKNPNGSWSDNAFAPIKTVIRHQLNQEQEGLCVYCEKELSPEEGSIDHIKPKGKNTSLTFSYTNLAHSCDDPEHCNQKKQDEVLPIEPSPGCNRFFSLSSLDGKLVPARGLTKKESDAAEKTIAILGLNTPKLAQSRKIELHCFRELENLSPQADMDHYLASRPFRWTIRRILNI